MEAFIRLLVLCSVSIALITSVTAKAGAVSKPEQEVSKTGQQEDQETKEEYEDLPSQLADYDTNKDGILLYEEFAYAIMSGHNITDPSELRNLFELCDKNGDESIDEEEFKASPLVENSNPAGSQKRVSRFFRLCYWRAGIRCYWVTIWRRICRVYYYRYCY